MIKEKKKSVNKKMIQHHHDTQYMNHESSCMCMIPYIHTMYGTVHAVKIKRRRRRLLLSPRIDKYHKYEKKVYPGTVL